MLLSSVDSLFQQHLPFLFKTICAYSSFHSLFLPCSLQTGNAATDPLNIGDGTHLTGITCSNCYAYLGAGFLAILEYTVKYDKHLSQSLYATHHPTSILFFFLSPAGSVHRSQESSRSLAAQVLMPKSL